VKIVYLDQMHWIGLAKARTGHPGGAPCANALHALTDGVASGTLMLPLSSVHYAEVGGTGSLRQRTDVALTMGALSKYVTIASRDVILKAELRHALGKWRGLAIPPPTSVDVFGLGFAFAFGERIGRGNITGPEAQKTRLFSRAGEVVDDLERLVGDGWTYSGRTAAADGEALVLGALRESADFVILRGPRPEDEPELRERHGYEPETFTDAIAQLAAREQALAEMLADGTTRKERLDDIIVARLWVWELGDLLPEMLAEFGIPRDELFDGGRAALAQILDDMPMMQVEYPLRRANFKNGSYLEHARHPRPRDVGSGDSVLRHCGHRETCGPTGERSATRPAPRDVDPSGHRRPVAVVIREQSWRLGKTPRRFVF
jgi:hypothetical protein